MKKKHFILTLILSIGLLTVSVFGQEGDRPAPPPPPLPRVAPTPPQLSGVLAKSLEKLPKNFQSSRENRQKAYAKLLEGQRYIWSMRRVREELSIESGARLAKDALREAVELDPTLAEAYTALAELAVWGSPQDIEEAISLSQIATKLDKDNFGGYRLLGRLNTIKSNLGRGTLNKAPANKAIAAWREVVRLDPRNAEGWAFLSAFFKETDETNNRIASLRNWLASSTPLDVGFYSRVMIQGGELSMENASIKLGEALIEDGNNEEALSVLTRAVSDSPNNLEAVGLLSQALENAKGKSLIPSTEALRQAVFANPENISLSLLLAQTIARSGDLTDAEKFLKESVKGYVTKDKNIAASFQLSLSDIYAEANQTDKAIESYKETLLLRNISKNELANDDDRDFAFLVINKMVKTYKNAERFEDAKNIINDNRTLFGKDDLSLDREYINLLRESGKKDESLRAVRSARVRSPLDYNLIRSEASILTELGRVIEGVALIQNLIDNKPGNVAPSIMYDDYINYLFISSLYIQANNNEKAIEIAHKAIDKASGKKERTQIAKITLASATQAAGNFDAAEDILKEILEETPDNPIALNNLGYLLLESGKKFEEALTFINKAVEIDPRNPSYLDSLGWAYYKLGKFDEAEKYLLKATQYNNSSSTIFEHLGDVYHKKGKSMDARNAWRKALMFSSNAVDTKRIEEKLAK